MKRIGFHSLLLLPLVGLSVALADVQRLALEHIAAASYSEVASQVSRKLADSGLAPSDIEDIAERVATGIATCTIAVLKQMGDEGNITITKLAQGVSLDEIEEPARTRADGGVFTACATQVLVEFGIALPN